MSVDTARFLWAPDNRLFCMSHHALIDKRIRVRGQCTNFYIAIWNGRISKKLVFLFFWPIWSFGKKTRWRHKVSICYGVTSISGPRNLKPLLCLVVKNRFVLQAFLFPWTKTFCSTQLIWFIRHIKCMRRGRAWYWRKSSSIDVWSISYGRYQLHGLCWCPINHNVMSPHGYHHIYHLQGSTVNDIIQFNSTWMGLFT